MPRNSPKLPTPNRQKLIAFSLILMACVLKLTGCASQAPAVVQCPEATPVPASLVSDKSQSVSSYLAKVRSYLKKAADFLETSMQTEKPSKK